MVGGIIADIYRINDRNTAMAIFAGAAFFGTGLGPLVSQVIAFHLSWRWVFYLQVITCGVLTGISFLLFEETRENVLLVQRAKALNKWYNQCCRLGMQGVSVEGVVRRVRWTGPDQRLSLWETVKLSVARPFRESAFVPDF